MAFRHSKIWIIAIELNMYSSKRMSSATLAKLDQHRIVSMDVLGSVWKILYNDVLGYCDEKYKADLNLINRI